MLALVKSACADQDGVLNTLKMAKEAATAFDTNPDYNASSIRFYYGKNETLLDDCGETALQGVENILLTNGAAELLEVWEQL